MVMPHHMMSSQHYAPPPYVPYHHHHQFQQQPLHVPHHHQQHGSDGENKMLWTGDLHNWMDENYLHRCCAPTGEITSIKVIRNKHSGDLAADVTDSVLHETFASSYLSVKAAKVVYDASTGRSKGYGFVRFGDESERSQAMTQTNGVYCSSRPMRIGAATLRKILKAIVLVLHYAHI